MTDVFGGIGFLIGIGWGLLAFMIIYHFAHHFVLNVSQQRAALLHLLFIACTSSVERVVLSLLATPVNLMNANELSPIIYIVTFVARGLVAVSIWALVYWIWFKFWPVAEREG